MTKGEEQVIRQVIAKLRPTHASAQIQQALTVDAKLYLETWVIPGLEWLLPEARDVKSAIAQTK